MVRQKWLFQWLKRHNFSEKFFVKNAYFLKFCRGPIFIVFWLFWLYNMSDTAMFFFQGYTHALDTWAVGCILGNYSSSSPSFIKVTFWNFSFHIKTIYKKWRTVCIKSSQYLRNNEMKKGSQKISKLSTKILLFLWKMFKGKMNMI